MSNPFSHICITLLYISLSDYLPAMYAVMLSSCRKGQPAEGEGRCQGYKPVYIYNQALLSREAAPADIGANAERHSSLSGNTLPGTFL